MLQNLHLLKTRIFYALTCLLAGCLVLSCSSPMAGLTREQKNTVLECRRSVSRIRSARLDTSVIRLKKSEILTGYRDDLQQLVRFNRQVLTPAVDLGIDLFFVKGELVSSVHLEINRARVRNKVEVTSKQYYFSGGQVVHAESKSLKSGRIGEAELLRRLERKKPSSFKAGPYIYRDEITFFERFKSRLQ